MCNGCERPPRGKQATYKRLRRKHNGRQCLYQQIRGEKTWAYPCGKEILRRFPAYRLPKKIVLPLRNDTAACFTRVLRIKNRHPKAGCLSIYVYGGFGLQQQAAGTVHNGACHLRCFIREQKRRYIAHFNGGAVFLRRDEQALFLRLFGALVKIRAVGDDVAGQDGVKINAVFGLLASSI